jgi:hypothetical protein
MATNRKRRSRKSPHSPIAERLFNGLPIEQTEANRQQLISYQYTGWCEYGPRNQKLGQELSKLATAELSTWPEEESNDGG